MIEYLVPIAIAAVGASALANAGLWLWLGRMQEADRGFERRQNDIIDRLNRIEDRLNNKE